MSWLSAASASGGGAAAAGGATSAGAGAASGATTFSAGGAGFSSAPYVSNAAPASFYSGAGTPAASVPAIPSGGGFSSTAMQATGPLIGEVAGIASGIAGLRVANANAKLAMIAAHSNANRIYAQLREVASRGRAIAGAQGSGGGGNDYLAFLHNLQAANVAARTAIYEGDVIKAQQKYAGRQALLAGISRAGTSLMSMGRS